MFSNEKNSKKLMKYSCNKCDFNSCNKNDYNRHVETQKHLSNDSQCFLSKKTQKNSYDCDCGRTYKDNSGLWRHRKTCTFTQNITMDADEKTEKESTENHEFQEMKEFMKYLMKENSEMKNVMMEVIKNGTHNTTNTNNISNNKTFNLQLFLNETCKDAMNIMDFVESIKLQLSDLERVGELGYVEGISNIIIRNLKDLDISQRPVHCTDKKRETIYIKDENKWEKDEEQKKMHKVIKKVADKNARLILKYKEVHPDCGTYYSKFSDQYNKIIVEAMGGSGDNDLEKEEKIIRNITKTIVIDK